MKRTLVITLVLALLFSAIGVGAVNAKSAPSTVDPMIGKTAKPVGGASVSAPSIQAGAAPRTYFEDVHAYSWLSWWERGPVSLWNMISGLFKGQGYDWQGTANGGYWFTVEGHLRKQVGAKPGPDDPGLQNAWVELWIRYNSKEEKLSAVKTASWDQSGWFKVDGHFPYDSLNSDVQYKVKYTGSADGLPSETSWKKATLPPKPQSDPFTHPFG